MSTEFDLRKNDRSSEQDADNDVALLPGKHTNTGSLASGAMGPMPGVPGKRATTEALSEPTHAKAGATHADAGGRERSTDANRLRGMLGKLESGGAALPDGVAREFSQLMGGADLSRVRVHTSGPASEHAAQIGARAFTHGSAIVFAPGAYDPASAAGRHILAHELVHVVQNQRSGGAAMQLAARMDVGPSGSAVESEAESGAHALTSGQSFDVASHGSLPGISMFGQSEPVPPNVYGGGDHAAAPAATAAPAGAAAPPANAATPPANARSGVTRESFEVHNWHAHANTALDYGRSHIANHYEVISAGIHGTADVRPTNAEAERYSVGFVQTMHHSTRRAIYQSPGQGVDNEWVVTRGQMLDQRTDLGAPIPWYNPPLAPRGATTQHAGMTDNPTVVVPMTSPGNAPLLELVGSESFTTYLVAMIAADPSTIVYLGHVNWHINWGGRFTPGLASFTGSAAPHFAGAAPGGGGAVLHGPAANRGPDGAFTGGSGTPAAGAAAPAAAAPAAGSNASHQPAPQRHGGAATAPSGDAEPNASFPPSTTAAPPAPLTSTSSTEPQVSSKPTTSPTPSVSTSPTPANENQPPITAKPTGDPTPTPAPAPGPAGPTTKGTPTAAPTGAAPKGPAPTGGGPTIGKPSIAPVPTTSPAPAPAVNFDAKVAEVLEQRADPGAKADYGRAVANVNIVRISALGYTFQKSGIGNTLFQTFVFPTEAIGDHWGQVYKNNQYRGNQSAGFNADTLQATIEGLRGVLHMVGDIMALISGWAGIVAIVSGLLALLTSATVIGGLTFGAIAAAADAVATITALIKLGLDIIDMVLGIMQMVILIIRARSTKDPAARARFAALLKKESGDLAANVTSCVLQVAVIAATAGTGAAFSKNVEGGFLKAFKKEFNELINPRIVFKGGIKGIGEKFTAEAAGKGVATGGRKVIGAEIESGVAGISVLKRNKLGRVTKARQVISFTTKNQMKGARLVQVNAAVAKIASKGAATTVAASSGGQLIVVTRAPDSKGSGGSAPGEIHVPEKPGSALTTVQMWPSQIDTFKTAKAPLGAAKERTEEQYANAQEQLGEAKSPAVKAKLKEVLERSKKSGEAAGNVEGDAAAGKTNSDKGQQTAGQGKDQKAKADANNAKIQGEGGKAGAAAQNLTPPPPKDGLLGKLYNMTIGKIGEAIGAAQNWLKNFVGKLVMYAAGFSKEELDFAGIENDMRFSSQQDEQTAKESADAKQQVAPIQQKVYELQAGLTTDEQQAVQGMADAMQLIAALEEAEEGLSKAIEGGGAYIEAVSPIVRHELETQAGGAKIDAAYVSPITSYADTFAGGLADTTTGPHAQQQVQVVFSQMVSQFPTLNVGSGETQIANLIGQYDTAHHTLEGQAKAEADKVKAAIMLFVGTADYAGVAANAAALDALVADFDKQEAELVDSLYKGINEILSSYVSQIEAAEAVAAATPDTATPDAPPTGTPAPDATPDPSSSTTPPPVAQPKAGGPVSGAATKPVSGGGNALPPHLAAKMGASLGADFSSVRVHEDGAADAMGAQAFAQGDDLHFGAGKYDPNSAGGQELLGHELAHVVQQRQGRVQPTMQMKGGGVVQDASLEAEADAHGAKAARGEPVGGVGGGGSTSTAIQMRPTPGEPAAGVVAAAHTFAVPPVTNIAAIPDPVNRNQAINTGYHVIDAAMTGYLGAPLVSNWFTYGQHASREAGTQIRNLQGGLQVLRDSLNILSTLSFLGGPATVIVSAQTGVRTIQRILDLMSQDVMIAQAIRLALTHAGTSEAELRGLLADMATVVTMAPVPGLNAVVAVWFLPSVGRLTTVIAKLIVAIPAIIQSVELIYANMVSGNRQIYENVAPAANQFLAAAQSAPNGAVGAMAFVGDTSGFLAAAFAEYVEIRRLGDEAAAAPGTPESTQKLALRVQKAQHANLLVGMQEQLIILQPLFNTMMDELAAMNGTMTLHDPNGVHPLANNWGDFYSRMGIDPATAPADPRTITPGNLPQLKPKAQRAGSISDYFEDNTQNEKIHEAPDAIAPM